MWDTGFFQALHSQEALQAYIQSFDAYPYLIFFVLQLLSVIIAPIPSNISAAAGGILFGTWPAFFITIAAVLTGSMTVFLLARNLGKVFAERFVSRHVSEKYLNLINRKATVFLSLIFLLPFFPDDVMCILAGLTKISARRFFFIILLTRPWGLLVASFVGGSAMSLPLWLIILVVCCTGVIFYFGMRYAEKIEAAVIKYVESVKK